MKILICGDDALIATMLEDIVAWHGHDACGVASSSEGALALAGAEEPDLAFVDLNLLDGRVGLRLVERLSEIRVPCVIVSGEARTLRPEESPAIACLGKPLDERRLADILATRPTL